MGDQLFAAIRGARVKPGVANEIARRMEIEILPAIRQLEGFKGFYLVANQDDIVTIVSLFSNRTAAEAAMQTVMPLVIEKLGAFLVSQPITADGIVLLSG